MKILILLCLVASIQAPERQHATTMRAAFAPVASIERVAVEPETESSWWWVEALVTGYSPHDANDSGHPSTQDTVTATMRDWRKHPYGIAADPRILPYGTHIHVPGYLEKSNPYSAWEVDDTGGAMRGSWRRGVIHIDMRFKTEWSAARFGKRKIQVLVDVSEMSDYHKKQLRPYKTGEL